jgi:hypothetical protein
MGARSTASVRRPAFTPTKLLEKIPTDKRFGVLSPVGTDEEADERHIEIDTASPGIPGSRVGKRSRELHGQGIVRVEPCIPLGSFVARGEGLAQFFLIAHVE